MLPWPAQAAIFNVAVTPELALPQQSNWHLNALTVNSLFQVDVSRVVGDFDSGRFPGFRDLGRILTAPPGQVIMYVMPLQLTFNAGVGIGRYQVGVIQGRRVDEDPVQATLYIWPTHPQT